MRRTGGGGGGGKRGGGGGGRGGGGGEEGRKRKSTTRMTKMMTVSVIQSTKFQIAHIFVSWLGIHFLSKVIPQTFINVLLTVTFRLKTY